VTAILTLLLLGGTTAGGMAWGGGGHGNNGGGAADAQYQPPKCTKDMRKCECPKGYSLTVSNGQIVCQKNAAPPPQECDDHKGRGNDHCDNGNHNGHGHHHHKQWRQHHSGHWQWCDDGRNWNNWNGRDDDW
jgi:hypothetical protein